MGKLVSNCTAKENDLACLGILVLDVFGKSIDRFPAKGTSEYFDKLEIHPGGCAYNTGVDASRLGLRVSVLGMLGADSFGDFIQQALVQEGVNTAGVRRSPEASTAFSFVMVPEDGQRRIYHTTGVSRIYGLSDICHDLVAGSRVFHVAGASLMPALDGLPTVDLLRFAREKGTLTSLDPVVRAGCADAILPCLPYLDVFLPNCDESVLITGLSRPEDQLRFYLDSGTRIVGIKLGEKGCLVGNGKETVRLGVYDVPVLDTCGAGDAFVAGFLYGLLQNWDMRRCALFATATAAFCVLAIGTTTAIPSARTVLDFMEHEEAIVFAEG